MTRDRACDAAAAGASLLLDAVMSPGWAWQQAQSIFEAVCNADIWLKQQMAADAASLAAVQDDRFQQQVSTLESTVIELLFYLIRK